MPTVVGPEQVTSVRSSLEAATHLLHPHSPGRATALQVTHTHTTGYILGVVYLLKHAHRLLHGFTLKILF